ncbi:TPA: CopY/TcrY family copper transport repressor [Streptococcus pyogenes]|uniref:CopY/TcrY family copper transport repressor n=1 Tax=Streptococcus pyogenes TaxID=1314 RepID=UPI00045924E6|nr:CopY/TcrY family copper transport repressor [Streptococcus pyogenes]HER4537220.1 CopY/TcrY family copper transport repressor [Streptococcus pyogenes NGAS673]HER4549261.1 CopY/TcrY family copper transport repressor [Streptococcus pyogenes NGAS660]HER4558002.1 CopY/TcrY family copper transport repressor [Streptococcus pyogenes NGAS672]HER4559553.1 CopY/TcrY family copper transport repressor [Streptococcus pyogenes NGAS663]HER4626928.1 CopY/TcrY family copper transport repressor [Streptococcus
MNQNISAAEWEVMRVVWASGDIKSSDIITILRKKYQWSDSTIKTLIGRLVEKKALGTYRQGRAYIYQALLDETLLQKEALATVLDGICQRQHTRLLLERLYDLPMTLEEIEAFQELLEVKKENAVLEVPCNCLPGQCHCQKKETY